MHWHEANSERWNQEQAIASQLLRGFDAGINERGAAFVRGIFDVYSEHGRLYESVTLRIVYPDKFPFRNQPPNAYLESHRDQWQNRGDSHIEDDWRLCLFVPCESGIDFTAPSSLNDFFAVIQTYMLKQRIYQKRLLKSLVTGEVAKWPGEDRSHGMEGIKEAIEAMGGIGRNDPCPCGNGKKWKKCHMRTMQN